MLNFLTEPSWQKDIIPKCDLHEAKPIIYSYQIRRCGIAIWTTTNILIKVKLPLTH